MKIVRDLFKSYKDHDCFSLAANISFFALLSLIPLLMIATSVAGYVLGGTEGLFNQVVTAFTDILPRGQEQFSANLNAIVSNKSRIGWVGVGFLLFIASLLFSSIEHAFDRIFQSVKSRNFFHSRLISVLLVFGVTFILFLPTMIGFFKATLAKFSIHVPLSSLATNKAFFVVMLIASFVVAVIIMPNRDVKFRWAVIGGVFFAVGVGIAKCLFRWYIATAFDRYNIIYGSLTALVVTIIWIYYLANVLLLSSELVAVLQRRYAWKSNGVNGSQG